MKRHMLAATTVVASLFLLTLGASRASADLTYNFTSDHCTGSCGTAPFGSVVLAQDGTSVDFVVSLFNGNTFAQTGAGDFLIFKFNATGVVVGDITITSPTTPALTATFGACPSNTTCLNGDGTGDFQFGIGCPTCGTGPTGLTGPLTFTVANSVISDFTTQNNLGQVFVADILSATTGNTGPVDASSSTVPDGGTTLMLLGGALVGLETLRRRFRV